MEEEKIEKIDMGKNKPTSIHVSRSQSIRLNYLHNLWMDKTKKMITKTNFINYVLEFTDKEIATMKETIVDPNDHTKLIQV